MWSFRKKPGRIQVAVTGKLMSGINRFQRKLADELNRRTAHVSTKKIKRYLLLFCVVFGGAHLLVLHYSGGAPAPSSPVAVPLPVTTAKAPAVPESPTVGEREKDIVASARHLFDSLARTPEGRAQRDSFLSVHPGFMDSLARAEQLIR